MRKNRYQYIKIDGYSARYQLMVAKTEKEMAQGGIWSLFCGCCYDRDADYAVDAGHRPAVDPPSSGVSSDDMSTKHSSTDQSSASGITPEDATTTKEVELSITEQKSPPRSTSSEEAMPRAVTSKESSEQHSVVTETVKPGEQLKEPGVKKVTLPGQ